MNTINDYLQQKLSQLQEAPQNKRRTERGDLVQQFREKLNQGRVENGFSEISFARMAGILKGKSLFNLYALYRECEQANHFGKLFWYKIEKEKDAEERRQKFFKLRQVQEAVSKQEVGTVGVQLMPRTA